MKVLLKIAYTQEYDIIVNNVDSIVDAMAQFDPCENLSDVVPVDGGFKIAYAVQIIDCPDCNGKGYHYFKNPDGIGNSEDCKTCHGNGYIRK